MSTIKLIAGLGNPGAKYESTRHNVGFWFIDELARSKGCSLRQESKFQGEAGKISFDGEAVWLIKPMTFMNLSGQSVSAIAKYYKLSVDNLLVVHDELDLDPGTLRLKQGGGHGGHNGLRDIVSHFGSKEFYRLRLGIGHPGSAADVSNYVLGTPSSSDRIAMEDSIRDGLAEIPRIIEGEFQSAMNNLHRRK